VRHVTDQLVDSIVQPGELTVDRSAGALEEALAAHRVELTAYCYRMLGSPFEADDAVQETLLRAWRSYDRFEGRSSLRTWLYRIATNACLDALAQRKRRATPMDLGPAHRPEDGPGPMVHEQMWLEPVPDDRILPTAGDPGELAVQRDTVRLAFVAALQHLPPRQRVVLLLREVLQWQAVEVADLLDTSVASVNSALQRARATLSTKDLTDTDDSGDLDVDLQDLLARYVDAFERYDMASLTQLLREDATISMPPYDLWLRGRDDIVAWMVGPGHGCEGSRLVPVSANGSPAFAQYRRGKQPGTYEPFAIHVLEIAGGRISALNTFLDTDRLFPLFGLPPRLEPAQG
jgi:RNA polymerase sigma-70 factor (ECF subfamily)